MYTFYVYDNLLLKGGFYMNNKFLTREELVKIDKTLQMVPLTYDFMFKNIFTDDLEILKDYFSMFDKMKALTMRENLLQLFHCLKEKDNAEFYSSHEEHPEWNIRLLMYFFYQMIINYEFGEVSQSNFPSNLYSYEQAYQILLYGIEHLKLAETTYTKNDYFNLIRYIIQI